MVLWKIVCSLPSLTVLLRLHRGEAEECQDKKDSDAFHTIRFQEVVPSDILLRDDKY